MSWKRLYTYLRRRLSFADALPSSDMLRLRFATWDIHLRLKVGSSRSLGRLPLPHDFLACACILYVTSHGSTLARPRRHFCSRNSAGCSNRRCLHTDAGNTLKIRLSALFSPAIPEADPRGWERRFSPFHGLRSSGSRSAPNGIRPVWRQGFHGTTTGPQGSPTSNRNLPGLCCVDTGFERVTLGRWETHATAFWPWPEHAF